MVFSRVLPRTALRRAGIVAAVLLPALAGLALTMAPGTRAQTSDAFFSEYVEGSSNNKALEIYNGTGSSIDLDAGDYYLQFFFNGSSSAGSEIALTGTVGSGAVYVLADDSADAAILNVADQVSNASFFNGDDAVVLRKGGTSGTILDVIGQVGFDPGSEWGSGDISTQNNTIRRRASVCAGDTNPSDDFEPNLDAITGEWDGFAQDTFAGLGAHTASCSATATPMPSATATMPPTATHTPMPTATSSPMPTATSTDVPASATPSATASPSPVPPSATPVPSTTPVPSATPMPSATNTPMPSATPPPSPTPAGQPADPILQAAASLPMSPAVANQITLLGNQVNVQMALASGLPPMQAQGVYTFLRQLLQNWIDFIIPSFVASGIIDPSSEAPLIAAFQETIDAIPLPY